MTGLDKSIKLNVNMIFNETVVLSIIMVGIAFTAASFISWWISIVFVIFAIVAVVKAYKTLFYTSIYGESAYLYNSVPLEVEEIVIGKIFAATFMSCVAGVTALAIIIMLLMVSGIEMTAMLDVTPLGETLLFSSNMGFAKIVAILPVELLNVLTSSVAMMTLLFCAISWVNADLGGGKSKTQRIIMAVFGVLAVDGILLNGISTVSDLFYLDYSLILSIVQIAINIVVVVFAYKATVKMLKEHYIVK